MRTARFPFSGKKNFSERTGKQRNAILETQANTLERRKREGRRGKYRTKGAKSAKILVKKWARSHEHGSNVHDPDEQTTLQPSRVYSSVEGARTLYSSFSVEFYSWPQR